MEMNDMTPIPLGLRKRSVGVQDGRVKGSRRSPNRNFQEGVEVRGEHRAAEDRRVLANQAAESRNARIQLPASQGRFEEAALSISQVEIGRRLGANSCAEDCPAHNLARYKLTPSALQILERRLV